MSREIKLLKNYLLYLLTGLLIIFIGLSNVFADTIVDTSTFIQTTGIQWSVSGQQYAGNPSYNNDWLLNNYYVDRGSFIGTDWNYVQFSYFEHNSSVFNPCNSSGKFTANFSFLFSTPTIVDQVTSVKWGSDNCYITDRSTQSGIINVSCNTLPSSNNFTDIFVYYSDSLFNGSYIYISRNIEVSCGLNTDAIINNDNQNTQNIINNNNQNTQDIIDNQNQNTQDMIENQRVCSSYDKNSIIENGFLASSDGSVSPHTGSGDSSRGVTDYIRIYNTSIISNTLANQTGSANNLCFYNINKSFISCVGASSYNNDSDITIPSNASYVRFTISSTANRPQFSICNNGNQALNDSINGLDSTLNDDDTSGATSEASDFFDSFSTDTFGLTSIVTAPLNVIQSILTSSCTTLRVPLPYVNKDLIIPCMTPVYGEMAYRWLLIYQDITYGVIAYWVCVRIFNMVKDFKNPEHDEIEVLDL